MRLPNIIRAHSEPMESDPVSIPRGAVNHRRHVARGLKWLGAGLAALVALGLAGCLTYPLWGGYGPWRALPTGKAPISQTVDDERFAEVGQEALEAIRVHRKKHGFPALTAAVSIGQMTIHARSQIAIQGPHAPKLESPAFGGLLAPDTTVFLRKRRCLDPSPARGSPTICLSPQTDL